MKKDDYIGTFTGKKYHFMNPSIDEICIEDIAAHYAGYEFVVLELDEDYYKAAVNRFELTTAQLGLF